MVSNSDFFLLKILKNITYKGSYLSLYLPWIIFFISFCRSEFLYEVIFLQPENFIPHFYGAGL